jgi:4-amino-4-deoxy-L-arabinose transferase-like glycosyltransferase
VTTGLAAPTAPPDLQAPGRPAFARWPVLGTAAAFVALELAVAARYGFHRDELYFLACARHMAWGYVDQPPFVPAVAWLTTHVVGTTVVGLRLLPALAGGTTVVLTGCMARELGGGRRAQSLAALAAATSPQVLAACHLLSTAAFDIFFWAVITFLLLRLIRTRDERLWLALGLAVGLGLLNKLNVAFLVAAIVFGLLVGRRGRLLLSPWAGAGAGIALVLWAPDVVWNAEHHWAALAMLRSLHQENGGTGAVLGFVPSQLLVVGPALIVFWLAGLRRLLRSETGRPLALAYLFLLVVFTLSGAKAYYLAGMYFVLFAGGGVWAEDRLRRREPPGRLRGWIALMVAGAVLALPLTLPVLPESALPAGSWEGTINKDLSATVGWPNFVQQVAGVASTLPPGQRADLVLFTGDYGAAGAIDLYGPRYGLPHAISGHNGYWWWGPAGARDGATTIAVSLSRSYLLTIFRQVTPAGTVTTPGGVWTEERGDPIFICRGQKEGWTAAWPAARHYG